MRHMAPFKMRSNRASLSSEYKKYCTVVSNTAHTIRGMSPLKYPMGPLSTKISRDACPMVVSFEPLVARVRMTSAGCGSKEEVEWGRMGHRIPLTPQCMLEALTYLHDPGRVVKY